MYWAHKRSSLKVAPENVSHLVVIKCNLFSSCTYVNVFLTIQEMYSTPKKSSAAIAWREDFEDLSPVLLKTQSSNNHVSRHPVHFIFLPWTVCIFFYFHPLLNYFSKLNCIEVQLYIFTFPWSIEWCFIWEVKAYLLRMEIPDMLFFLLKFIAWFLFCVHMWIRGAYIWPIVQCLVWYAFFYPFCVFIFIPKICRLEKSVRFVSEF